MEKDGEKDESGRTQNRTDVKCVKKQEKENNS